MTRNGGALSQSYSQAKYILASFTCDEYTSGGLAVDFAKFLPHTVTLDWRWLPNSINANDALPLAGYRPPADAVKGRTKGKSRAISVAADAADLAVVKESPSSPDKADVKKANNNKSKATRSVFTPEDSELLVRYHARYPHDFSVSKIADELAFDHPHHSAESWVRSL